MMKAVGPSEQEICCSNSTGDNYVHNIRCHSNRSYSNPGNHGSEAALEQSGRG